MIGLVYVWGTQARGRVAGLTAARAPRRRCRASSSTPTWPASTRRSSPCGRWRPTCTGARCATEACSFPCSPGSASVSLLDTKHNSWFLPIACTAHFLALQAWALLARTRLGPLLPVPPAPGTTRKRGFATLVVMALLAPPVLVALWPWLWHDTRPPGPRVRALPPEPRVLQHGVPRPELLGCAHAEGIRVGDDGGDRAHGDAGALPGGPGDARLGVGGRRRPADRGARGAAAGSRRRGGNGSAVAPLHRHQLCRLALAADTHLRRHQALDDGVSLPGALRRSRVLGGGRRGPGGAVPPAAAEPGPAARGRERLDSPRW